MLAAALLLAPAWGAAQEPSALLVARLGLEGPLDNDTTRPGNERAATELAAGDALLAQDPANEGQSVGALEAWRRALLESSPLDAVAVDARTSVGVARAVRDRLGPALAERFAARFQDVAARALFAAGSNQAALERVSYENPFTHAAALADLRLCDLARERGDGLGARTVLARLERDLPLRDSELARAVARRRASLPPRGEATPAGPARVSRLELEDTLALGADFPAQSRFLEPAAAEGADGTWIQSGERLVLWKPTARPVVHALAELVSSARPEASWVEGFGDRERAWLQRPALAGTRLALVLGRARETRGNALALFDVAGAVPRLAWIHHDGESGDAALLPGVLEFQMGPLLVDDLVVVQILQWQDVATREAEHVDGRRTHAWLVALDAADGRMRWRRELAYGADRRGRELDRLDAPRPVSSASPALRLQGGERVLAGTELGVLAEVSCADGRLEWERALKRVSGPLPARFVSAGPLGARGSWALSPADASPFVYSEGEPWPVARRIDGLERLLDARPDAWWVLVSRESRTCLQRIEPGTGATSSALPLPRGDPARAGRALGESLLVVAGGTLLAFDAGTDPRLAAALDLADLAREPHVGLWAGGGRVYVLGTSRIWVVRVD